MNRLDLSCVAADSVNMPTANETLIEHLELLQSQGQDSIWVDDEAKEILRDFYINAQKKDQVSLQPQTAQQASPAPAQPNTQAVAQRVPAAPAEPQAPTKPRVPALSAVSNIEQLLAAVQADSELKALNSLRPKLIAPQGSIKSGIMVVAESPSYNDEQAGLPFSGPAGKKMAAILKAMGLQLEDVHSTYLVKHRPDAVGQTINTRKPNNDEVDHFLPYLRKEIELVKPRVVIALGSLVAKALVGFDVPAKQLLGQFNDAQGVPVRSTYHPSYLLQDGITPEKKWVWQDMLAIMELLEIPISEKQRGYFS